MSTDPYDTLTGIPVASQAYATDIVGPPFLGTVRALSLFGTRLMLCRSAGWTFQLLGYG